MGVGVVGLLAGLGNVALFTMNKQWQDKFVFVSCQMTGPVGSTAGTPSSNIEMLSRLFGRWSTEAYVN